METGAESASNEFSMHVDHLDGQAEVVVVGELDIATTPQLRAGLDQLIGQGQRDIRINASGLRFLDASAVGVLIEFQQRLRDLGGDLRLHQLFGPPLRTLTVCDLVPGITDIRQAGIDGADVDGALLQRRLTV